MEEIRREKDELSGESYYSDTDLTSQLREKVRSQAHRLRGLEQYRILCEQRIQDLSPGHSLPVKPEHLGTPQASNELKLAKQKISRLESQLSQASSEKQAPVAAINDDSYVEKYNSLLDDKCELEESLRAEMLTCEEQRAYIEVLKQAMEAKVEECAGGKAEAPSVQEAKEVKPRADESRREQARLKNTLLDYESQIKRFQAQAKNKEAEMERLTRERDELDSHLRQAAEALQIAEEEVDKLEEEKTNLLEYVDEHSVKEQEMEKDLNELGRYCEEMKASFEKTRKELEEERSSRGKYELESEVYNEEIYKANKTIKELQSAIGALKASAEDKDNYVRTTKEEKINFEIKIESLQANAATLAETLKENQSELEEVQGQLDLVKKQDAQKHEILQKLKSENYSFSLENNQYKESLAEIKRDLEQEKKERLDIERMREMDIKQVQEFKLKLSQMKSKCEGLEEDKKFRAELEHYRILDAEKFSQLQEEFNYLQESYRETQQRELIQSEALNDLRKHNSDLTREIEELYHENQQISLEFSKKSQDLEAYFNKFNEINDLRESLESEVARLDSQIKSERATSKQLKEKSLHEKSKIEELNNSLQDFSQAVESLQRKLKEKEDEAQHTKIQLKSKERDFEDERYCRAKLTEELQEVSGRLEYKEKELERIQSEVVESCKIIAGFSGKYIATANDFRSNISIGYKEFLFSWKDKMTTNSKMLSSWIVNTVEEIESLTRQVFEMNKELYAANYELSKITSRLDGVSSGEIVHKQENSKIKSQLETISKKYESFRDISEKEINTLRLEVNSLKNELGILNHENNELKDTLHKSMAENSELKLHTDMVRSSLKTHEDRVNLLKTEKNQLENLLSQVQRSLGSSEINKIYNEIARIRNELEILERERLNLQCQLLKFEADPRSKETESFKELSQKLIHCERQIRNFKKSIQILQEDANKEEMVQKLRGDRDSIKRTLGPNSNNPQTGNLLYPRYSESPQSLKRS